MTGLGDMPAEILQLIAYEVRVLGPADVGALARTSSWVRAALQGDAFSRDLHRALAGFHLCVSKGWWRAARLGMVRGWAAQEEASEWFNKMASGIDDCFVEIGALCATPGASSSSSSSSSSVVALVEEMVRAKLALPWFTYTVACMVGEEAVVAAQLESKSYDDRVWTKGLVRAAGCGQVGVIEMLLADPRVDPAENHCRPLLAACKHGEARAVEALLRDRRISPVAFYNYPLSVSATFGHLDVVKVLMDDERVDPSADDNYALQSAIDNGHTEVMALLLTDPRVSLPKATDTTDHS